MNTEQTTELENEKITPCPLERTVGRRTGKEWLLAFALSFRSWLLTIRRNTRQAAIAPYGPGKEWLLAFALAFRSWLLNIRRNTRSTAIAPYGPAS